MVFFLLYNMYVIWFCLPIYNLAQGVGVELISSTIINTCNNSKFMLFLFLVKILLVVFCVVFSFLFLSLVMISTQACIYFVFVYGCKNFQEKQRFRIERFVDMCFSWKFNSFRSERLRQTPFGERGGHVIINGSRERASSLFSNGVHVLVLGLEFSHVACWESGTWASLVFQIFPQWPFELSLELEPLCHFLQVARYHLHQLLSHCCDWALREEHLWQSFIFNLSVALYSDYWSLNQSAFW